MAIERGRETFSLVIELFKVDTMTPFKPSHEGIKACSHTLS